MPLIEALQTGVLYRNPIPHGRSVHAYSPCLLVLCRLCCEHPMVQVVGSVRRHRLQRRPTGSGALLRHME